jgi:tight adherence protein B
MSSLWVVCGLAFVGQLALVLLLVFTPQARRRAAAKRARLEEVARYRVLGAANAHPGGSVDLAVDAPGAALRVARDHVLAASIRYVDKNGRRGRIAEQLEQAGLRVRPEEWIAIVVSAVISGALPGLLLFGPIGAVVGAALGFVACVVFRHIRTSRRRTAFEAQLPDALQLIAASLRAGLAMTASMTTLVREGIEPVSAEFARTLQEVRLGATLEDAMEGVAHRTASPDMQLVAVAVRTAREVGGNLAEVLQTTATTMRERAEVRGQVRTLSAEGKISAKILVALPLLMTAYLLTFKRSYLQPLYSTGIGIAMIVVGVFLLATGSFWLSRLTKIEV